MKKRFLISRKRKAVLLLFSFFLIFLSISNAIRYVAKNINDVKAADSYYINVVHTGQGSVTGGGEYIAGSAATIVAYPDVGWCLLEWTKNGSSFSRLEAVSFTVNESATYEASFSRNCGSTVYTVSVAVASGQESMGTVSGGGSGVEGTQVTISATANPGYEFDYWSNNYNSNTNPNPSPTFNISGNITYYAHFKQSGSGGDEPTPDTFLVTVQSASTSKGTVNTEASGNYASGDSITVQATPNSGYEFDYWSINLAYIGDGTTCSSNPCTRNVYGRTIFTAYFKESTPTQYTVSVSVASGQSSWGTVSGGGTYAAGAQVTVSATPSSGYEFDYWEGASTTFSSFDIYPLNSDKTYVAHFKVASGGDDPTPPTVYYTITPVSENVNMGTVSGGGTVEAGNSVTIVATPKEGYEFVNWTDDQGATVSSANYTFTPNRSATYTAHFRATSGGDDPTPPTPQPTYYTITVQSEDLTMGTVSGGDTVEEGDSITITATPKEGYEFVKWTNNQDDTVVTDASYTFTVTKSATYTAHFKAVEVETYSVAAEIAEGQEDMGDVSGSDPAVIDGESITLIATPKKCYVFDKWTNNLDEDFVSTEAELEVTPDADVIYTAHFKASDDEKCEEDEEDDLPVPDTGMYTSVFGGGSQIMNLVLPAIGSALVLGGYIIIRNKHQVRFTKK